MTWEKIEVFRILSSFSQVIQNVKSDLIVDKMSPNCREIVDKLSFVNACSQRIMDVLRYVLSLSCIVTSNGKMTKCVKRPGYKKGIKSWETSVLQPYRVTYSFDTLRYVDELVHMYRLFCELDRPQIPTFGALSNGL